MRIFTSLPGPTVLQMLRPAGMVNLMETVLIGRIRKAIGFFRGLNPLRRINVEYFKIAKVMFPVVSLAVPFPIHFRRFRQPQNLIVRPELHRSVIDRKPLLCQFDLFHGLHKLGFESRHLKGASVDPRAAF